LAYLQWIVKYVADNSPGSLTGGVQVLCGVEALHILERDLTDNRKCSQERCDRRAVVRGVCRRCYQRARIEGRLDTLRPPIRKGNSGNFEAHRRAGIKGGTVLAMKDHQHMVEMGRQGGISISRNREHMAIIGRRGGLSLSLNTEHMRSIGRKGALVNARNRTGAELGPEVSSAHSQPMSDNHP
jgi:general stress protein YciG